MGSVPFAVSASERGHSGSRLTGSSVTPLTPLSVVPLPPLSSLTHYASVDQA